MPASEATRLIIVRIIAESSTIRMLGPVAPGPVIGSTVMMGISSASSAQARLRNTAGCTGSRPWAMPFRLSECAMNR